MPCYDPETHERPKRMERRLHFLTEMLCGLCGRVEAAGLYSPHISASEELVTWWEQHKLHDADVVAAHNKYQKLGANDPAWEKLSEQERDYIIKSRMDLSHEDGKPHY